VVSEVKMKGFFRDGVWNIDSSCISLITFVGLVVDFGFILKEVDLGWEDGPADLPFGLAGQRFEFGELRGSIVRSVVGLFGCPGGGAAISLALIVDVLDLLEGLFFFFGFVH